MELLEALEFFIFKSNKARMRLLGPKPHPNNIAWAKEILKEAEEKARAAIEKARLEDHSNEGI